MLVSEQLLLNWSNFQDHATSTFRELRECPDFSDVTLACEDGNQMETHKIILVSASPFFEQVFKRNRHDHPLIYLKGVKMENLQAVMDFIYYGETNVAQDNIDSFLDLAKELMIKGLMTSVMRGRTSKSGVDEILRAKSQVSDGYAKPIEGNTEWDPPFETTQTLNSAPHTVEEKEVSIDCWSDHNQEPSELDKNTRAMMTNTDDN